MPVIILYTKIAAPQSTCFDCSRDIDLHARSVHHTGETAIAGRTSGLITLNETVTWRAKHLGIWQQLTTRITEMIPSSYFADEQVKGAFSSFRHEHYFEEERGQTIMKDIFTFKSPAGIIGKIFNLLFLTKYMKELLVTRNQTIKAEAEKMAFDRSAIQKR